MAKEYVPYAGPVVTREEAQAQGLKRYFTGKPCHKDHIAERGIAKGMCCECERERARARSADPEYRESRKEYWAQWQKDFRAREPERAYSYSKTPHAHERQALQARERRKLPGSKHKEWTSKSWQKHKEKRMAEHRAWVEKNKEAVLLYMRNVKAKRRAQERDAEGSFTVTDIRHLFEKQEGQCAVQDCRVDLTNKFDVDHIQSIARGGSNWPNNLQLLCPTCNRSKGARTMEEWESWKARCKTAA